MILRLPIGLLDSNSYLVYDEAARVGAIVDPGVQNPQPLQRAVAERDLTIRYLLNTHGHFDHVAGNARLDYPDAQLGLHPADRDLLAEGGGASWLGMAYVPSPLPDLLLEDGDELEIGALTLRVIHTPGHTPGSVCLYVPEDEALLTGDTLFAGSVGRTDLPGGSAQQLTASLKRLLTLPGDTHVYPGHGDPTTLARERRLNPWLQNWETVDRPARAEVPLLIC